MGQHFGDGEAFGRRFPARIFFGQLGDETAQNSRGRLQKVQAGESISSYTSLWFALVVLFVVDIGMVFQGFQVSHNFGGHP